jgi:peptide/nickel transport system permease protein
VTLYFIRRILLSIPILFGITLLSFLIIHFSPGDPVDMLLDPNTPKEMVEATRVKLGLNQPIHVQYFRWASQILRGNLGYSFKTYQPVSHLLAERIGPTFLLMGSGMLAGILIGVLLGVLSAVKQFSWLDYASSAFSLLGISVPSFFLGMVLIYFFSLKLGVLPSSGTMTPGVENSFIDRLRHLLLPAFVLSFYTSGQLTRYVRSCMLEVLGKEYLRTARAKGLREWWVIMKHALRNAMIPVVTLIGMQIPELFGGAIITEQLFSWPGIGQLTVGAMYGRDYPVLLAINLITAILVIGSSLLTDLIYVLFDPRIKYR